VFKTHYSEEFVEEKNITQIDLFTSFKYEMEDKNVITDQQSNINEINVSKKKK